MYNVYSLTVQFDASRIPTTRTMLLRGCDSIEITKTQQYGYVIVLYIVLYYENNGCGNMTAAVYGYKMVKRFNSGLVRTLLLIVYIRILNIIFLILCNFRLELNIITLSI